MLWNGWSIYHSLQVNVSSDSAMGLVFQGACGCLVEEYSYRFLESTGPRIKTRIQTDFDSSTSGFPLGHSQHSVSLNFVGNALLVEAPAARSILLLGLGVRGFTVQSGQPFSVEISTDQARIGNTQLP